MTDPRVLVLYPREFACKGKLRRKLESVLSRMERFELLHFGDPRAFLSWVAEDARCIGLRQAESLDDVTHSIVFDDGEEFGDMVGKLEDRQIPHRVVKIKITRVINIKKDDRYAKQKSTPTYEYIGRGSDWGNPYSMFDASDEGLDSREEVIRKYAYDFHKDLLRRSRQDALALAGKRLGCFCKPEICHGDVLAEFLNAQDDGR